MQKNEGFFRLEKLSRDLCTTVSLSQEMLLFQVRSDREHSNNSGPVPWGLLKSQVSLHQP